MGGRPAARATEPLLPRRIRPERHHARASCPDAKDREAWWNGHRASTISAGADWRIGHSGRTRIGSARGNHASCQKSLDRKQTSAKDFLKVEWQVEPPQA